MRRAMLAAILCAIALASPAAARPLDKSEARALDKAVAAYFAAIGKGDAGRVVAAMPPRLVSIYSRATGLEAGRLHAMLAEQTAALMAGMQFRDFTSDLSALDAAEDELADGSRITWVLVPTAFVSETNGKATRNEQPLLAVLEGRNWYFLRIDGKERRDVAALAYPFLAGRDFPAARTSPAE